MSSDRAQLIERLRDEAFFRFTHRIKRDEELGSLLREAADALAAAEQEIDAVDESLTARLDAAEAERDRWKQEAREWADASIENGEERDRLAAALEAASVRLGELTQPPWNELTPLVAEVRDSVREALGKGDTRAV